MSVKISNALKTTYAQSARSKCELQRTSADYMMWISLRAERNGPTDTCHLRIKKQRKAAGCPHGTAGGLQLIGKTSSALAP